MSLVQHLIKAPFTDAGRFLQKVTATFATKSHFTRPSRVVSGNQLVSVSVGSSFRQLFQHKFGIEGRVICCQLVVGGGGSRRVTVLWLLVADREGAETCQVFVSLFR